MWAYTTKVHQPLLHTAVMAQKQHVVVCIKDLQSMHTTMTGVLRVLRACDEGASRHQSTQRASLSDTKSNFNTQCVKNAAKKLLLQRVYGDRLLRCYPHSSRVVVSCSRHYIDHPSLLGVCSPPTHDTGPPAGLATRANAAGILLAAVGSHGGLTSSRGIHPTACAVTHTVPPPSPRLTGQPQTLGIHRHTD